MKGGGKLSKEKKRKPKEDPTKEGQVYFEVWGILFILITIILLSELGPVGETLNILTKMIFGDWYWIILIFLFYYGTLMIIYHQFITYSSIKIKGMIFLSAGLLIYTHFPIYNAVISDIEKYDSNVISESYSLFMSYIENQNYNGVYGGGMLGATLFWLCINLLGEVGTKISAIILLISGISYLFEKTIYEFIDDTYYGSKNAFIKVKHYVSRIFNQMAEVSKLSKNPSVEVKTEKIKVQENNNVKFENIVMTKAEKFVVEKGKYIKPNSKQLKYHENKGILESQKEITINNGKIINEFTRSLFLSMEINEIYIGPTISTYIIDIENTIKSKKIISNKEELFLMLETRNIRIYDKYENKHSLYIEVPNKFRYLVSLREILEEETDEKLFPIGRNYRGQVFSIDFKQMSNILVIGHDIDSKIMLLKTIISSILYRRTPDEFKLVICDSTKYELNDFENNHHLYYELIDNFQSMKPMLIKLYTEVEQRLNNINYQTKDPTAILLILNDFVDFYINNDEFLKYLNYILVYGSKVNVFTIYSTSNLDDKIINNNLKAQFDTTIALMMNSKEVSFKYIEDDTSKLLKDGDCLILSRSVNTNIRVQIANLTDEDIIN
jgi:S-DNA-T family DNA segregation ATPase FtsK/SpoIIIE